MGDDGDSAPRLKTECAIQQPELDSTAHGPEMVAIVVIFHDVQCRKLLLFDHGLYFVVDCLEDPQ